jgi:hypothetical protein
MRRTNGSLRLGKSQLVFEGSRCRTLEGKDAREDRTCFRWTLWCCPGMHAVGDLQTLFNTALHL